MNIYQRIIHRKILLMARLYAMDLVVSTKQAIKNGTAEPEQLSAILLSYKEYSKKLREFNFETDPGIEYSRYRGQDSDEIE